MWEKEREFDVLGFCVTKISLSLNCYVCLVKVFTVRNCPKHHTHLLATLRIFCIRALGVLGKIYRCHEDHLEVTGPTENPFAFLSVSLTPSEKRNELVYGGENISERFLILVRECTHALCPEPFFSLSPRVLLRR